MPSPGDFAYVFDMRCDSKGVQVLNKEAVATMPHRRCKNTTLGLGYTDIDGVIAMCECLTDPIIIGDPFSIHTYLFVR